MSIVFGDVSDDVNVVCDDVMFHHLDMAMNRSAVPSPDTYEGVTPLAPTTASFAVKLRASAEVGTVRARARSGPNLGANGGNGHIIERV